MSSMSIIYLKIPYNTPYICHAAASTEMIAGVAAPNEEGRVSELK